MSTEVTTEMMNRAIALFINMELKQDMDDPGFEWEWVNGHNGSFWPNKTPPPFNKCWDWLMPVVEKIQELKEWREDKKELRLFSTITIDIEFDGHYKKSRCSIIGTITHCHNESIPHTYTEVPVPHIWVADKKTAIEAVYNAVYQFITWYNQQKQTNDNTGTHKG